jgi:purine-binding chemotaxis protein CheW
VERAAARPGAPAAESRSGIQQFVVFRLGDNDFAVPIEQVQEILVFTPLARIPKVPGFIEGIINVRGKIIPVVNLCERLNLSGRPRDQETRIVVVEVAEQTVGMIVDMVTEVAKLPPKAIEPPPPLITTVSPRFVTGVGKEGGRILVILNLDRLLSPEEMAEIGAPGSSIPASGEAALTSPASPSDERRGEA